jgi:hypothetical protein
LGAGLTTLSWKITNAAKNLMIERKTKKKDGLKILKKISRR